MIVDKIRANKKIIMNVIQMTIIVSAIYLVSYAWFTRGETVNMEDISISTRAVNEIQISLDNGATWSNLATLNIDSNFTFNNEITSNGINFYKASVKLEDGTPTNFVSATSNADYLDFNIMFKAKFPTSIFLDTKSKVVPAVGVNANDLIGTTGIIRKSTMGDFSRDLIAGAVRVAFIDNTLVGEAYVPLTTASLVWAPNKNYEIAIESGAYVPYINSTNNQSYDYVQVSSETSFQTARLANIKDSINASFDLKSAGGDPLLTNVNVEDLLTHLYIQRLTVRVWVEGNDREAITPLKGGLFKIQLAFIGLDKSLDTVEPSVTANVTLNKIIGFTSLMEYSFDYGNNWFNYSYNNDPIFDEGSIVYVRKSETSNVFASVYRTLNF